MRSVLECTSSHSRPPLKKHSIIHLIAVLCSVLIAPLSIAQSAANAPKKLTILAVGAHMDDAEGGVGGILTSAAQAGHRVVVVVTVSDDTTWMPMIGREAQCAGNHAVSAAHSGADSCLTRSGGFTAG